MSHLAGKGFKLIKKVYADLTGYDTAAAFTVTGDVEVIAKGVVGATGITSTSGTTTLELSTPGTAGGFSALIPETIIDNANFAAGDVWVDGVAEADAAYSPTNVGAIANGADLSLVRSADDITAGSLTVYLFWRKLSANGKVVAA